MEDIQSQAKKLQTELEASLKLLKYDDLMQRLNELEAKTKQSDFWKDNEAAQASVKELSKLSQRLKPWQQLKKDSDELVELSQLNDESIINDIKAGLEKSKQDLAELKQALRFAGPFDDHEAIVSLYAGAGGTDAQDWTQILLRMYSRWAEKNRYKVKTIEESAGEEAGLKSITIEIDGDLVYGKLKGEHGVHRLVRLSPFNADHLRQTSFAKVEVLPKIEQPSELELDDKDLKIDVYRSGGHGGQSVNTTDSAVRITHLPTGISVSIQNERSQLQNKETALTILRSKLAQLQLEQHQEKLSDIKGPNQSAEWGNQIRSYVLHPYKQVKDLRTKYETSDVNGVLDGKLDELINFYLEQGS